MSFVIIPIITNHSTYILMHLTWCIYNARWYSCCILKQEALLVHRWIMPQLIRNSFVSLQHYTNFVQCWLVLKYMYTQTRKASSQHWWLITAMSLLDLLLTNTDVEGPLFSRLLHSYVSSPLVGKKAANVVSNSKSNNRNESSHSLLMNDGDMLTVLWISHAFLQES